MPHTMGDSSSSHLDIQLESSELVLRGFTGEELEPAVLKGELVLNLSEATNLKEIQLIFTGTAKVTWRDSSTHHFDHPLFFHDFSFLNPSSSSTPHPASKNTPVHTLKAGRHLFPFSLHIPGSLPASLRTYSGTCVIEYKLKAIATRPGFSADWRTKKLVRISRGFGVDAVEYNQTLEIENTWPGKVMYAFTIPHKAYAAGETIPVSVKFSPLAKGVRIVSLVTTIREHTTVHSKSSSHSEARDATVVKYNFVPETGGSNTNSGTASPHPPARIESSASLSSMNAPQTPTTPAFPVHGTGTPLGGPEGGSGGFPGFAQRLARNRAGDLAGEGEDDTEATEEVDDGQDTEVDVVVDVPVPVWTAPSHTVHPCFINHKIKWSAFIKNPDGHVSELRCALPIHILASSLAEEARLASAGSRNLLFGESGVLAHSDVPQVDLPSYQDHVMDRVANAETASYFSLAAGFAPTPWSQRGTPTGTPGAAGGTPMASPPHSRPPSRPPSPHRANSTGHGAAFASSLSMATSYGNHSRSLASRRSSGTVTPVTTSPPGELFDEEHPENHRNWIDSELMSTLALDHTSPPGSNPTSRPGSRPGSRPPSRPASPDHHSHYVHSSAAAAIPLPQTPASEHPPPLARSATSSGGFFHLHIPKPLRPLTAFSRNGSSSNLSAMGRESHSGSSSHSSNEHHPSASALSNALAAHAAKSSRHAPQPSLDIHTHSAMSNSPISGPSAASSPISSSPAQPSPHWPPSTSYTTTSSALQHSNGPSRPGSPSPSHTPSLGRTGHDSHHSHTPNWEEEDPLNSVPSYEVAARGFLGGGVVPISFGLPGYDDEQSSSTSAQASPAPPPATTE
ncbi:hypothetical protein BCR35DRAFT_300097 [Leucosporidium creatinivorum]|uniref:Arrestin C-terminal-like domain-containing protein n=1 Tax=Leucosporidium creatinivorum TaxID=106004 RepID=A0A1Y2FZN7_9BASI|nr:hypothetical protein BCR35DRAFT_300097 [Leucosporidium creatinivorum]